MFENVTTDKNNEISLHPGNRLSGQIRAEKRIELDAGQRSARKGESRRISRLDLRPSGGADIGGPDRLDPELRYDARIHRAKARAGIDKPKSEGGSRNRLIRSLELVRELSRNTDLNLQKSARCAESRRISRNALRRMYLGIEIINGH